MEPLRITARMQEPIVYYGDGLHLDGPLSYGAYMALPREEREALPPISGDWAEDFELPLARWVCETPLSGREDARLLTEDGAVWGWCCSAVHADWALSARHAVRKMPDTDAMVRWGKDRSVHLSGGQLKACQVEYPGAFASFLVWYALGALEEVRSLLMRVRNLGKMSNHGCGRVMEWRVEPWPEDWSRERAGRLTRRMPAGYRPQEPAGMAMIRAPYHHRSRRILCVEPDYASLAPAEVSDE